LARRAVLSMITAAVAGCSVRPLYGSAFGPGDEPPRRIALTPMPGRDGFIFREAMRRRFVLDADAPMVLTVDLALAQRGVALTRVGDTTRLNIDGTARFTLATADGGAPPLTGEVRTFIGYSTLASPYATRVARDAAEERAIRDLAERIFTQIAVQGDSAT
jgi:LPS-assembly lipoprotein